MTYVLTTGQRSVIETLVNNQEWAAAYSTLAGYLQGPVENEDVPAGVQTWIAFAAQINDDSGSWSSEYVRNYTMNAGNITEQQFQNASDSIAENFFDMILNPPQGTAVGTIPAIDQVIENDVVGAVNELGLDDEDWAGTLVADVFFGYPAIENFIDTPQDVLEQFGRGMWTLGQAGGGLKNIGVWIPYVLEPFDLSKLWASPLVLDLDGDGVELAALNGTGSVYWDIDVDGMGEASGWVTGGDGLLCVDLNEDGVINDHAELFGDQTGAANGFAALAAYDSNSDGYITSADTNWDKLLVWVDENADGRSQASELHTLDDLNITSIDLDYDDVNYTISGNEIKQASTFTIDGNTRDIVDAWFAYDNVNTVYTGDFTLDPRVLFLPTLRGYGNLPDLHIAMS